MYVTNLSFLFWQILKKKKYTKIPSKQEIVVFFSSLNFPNEYWQQNVGNFARSRIQYEPLIDSNPR